MKCVICNGEHIIEQRVNEEIHVASDIVLEQIACLVCQSCGERYYDTATMRHLEKVRADLKNGSLQLKQVGKILSIEGGTAFRAAA